MTLEQIKSFLDTTVFTLADHEFSLAEIMLIPFIVIAGIWLTRKIASIITEKLIQRGTNADIVHLIRRVLYVIALLVLAITILDFLNVPIAAFAFLSGAVAIGIGFGAQNIINNFISGWILMWERPIRIGDVRFRIDELFNQNKIVISFPQRDVHIDGEVKITRA